MTPEQKATHDMTTKILRGFDPKKHSYGATLRQRQSCQPQLGIQRSKRRLPKLARDTYIYAWYDGDSLIYIGMGHDDRAIATHDGESEALRQNAGDRWRYKILVDNLTDDVARATELALIRLHDPPGNVTNPLDIVVAAEWFARCRFPIKLAPVGAARSTE